MRSSLIVAFILAVLVGSVSATAKSSPRYSVPEKPWPERFGNHRAILTIDRPADAVHLQLLWRRHDSRPAEKRMLIVNVATGDTVANVLRKEVSNERCELIFGPVKASGVYCFYYLAYEVQQGWGFYGKDYLRPEPGPERTWIERNDLNNPSKLKALPSALCNEIQSRTEFDSFSPMEVIPTREEMTRYLQRNSGDYLIFAEDRKYPIRMRDEIPERWLSQAQGDVFQGEARRNEYYAFQIGLVAVGKKLENVRVDFSDLKSKEGKTLAASAMTCYNTGGIDAYGKAFTRKVDVEKGKVQALWIGLDITAETSPALYEGTVTISPQNGRPRAVKLRITITRDVAADRGDSEPWRHSRLRWLNSTIGINDEPVAPYVPVHVSGSNVSCLGRTVMLNEIGLPSQIESWGNQILFEPLRFVIETQEGFEESKVQHLLVPDQKPGKIRWEGGSRSDELEIVYHGDLEFDGHMGYRIEVTARNDVALKDIRLQLPMKREYADLMMGMSRPGGPVPEHHESKWTRVEDSFWFGNAKAGIHCELRGATYNGPMLNLYKPAPPQSWDNSGRGGFRIDRDRSGATATVFSGARDLKKGERLTFEFALIITPVKQINYRSQFVDRYYHNGGSPLPSDEDLAAGVKVVNLHHANKYNPYINYPFIAQKELRAFVDDCHAKNLKVKLYYTVRELTNHVTEMLALRSLGEEILAGGSGGGYPWLREHLIDDYTPQWYQHWDDLGEVDAAILTSGESRWYNYYIEGLGWLVKNSGIDGLYLDDVTYDRRILERMRKVMEMNKPGCLMDLHSNTGFSMGPANQYMEYFPFVDKLWFGESFQYDEMIPENWLVEVSGIPFGLMGDMLQGGGNRWRGMLYGMTVRHPWVTDGVTCDPRPIWRIWDEFGIQDARMVGYWEAGAPVKTSDPRVLATSYVKDEKVLVALASWAERDVNVALDIDWNALHMSRADARISAPEIRDFQTAERFTIGSLYTIHPKEGMILVIEAHR